MFSSRLDSDRFFARIRSMDLECPGCGRVYVGTGKHGPFNKQLGRFVCPNPECKLVLSIGVLAYPATRSPKQEKIPGDWIPTARQAAALREATGGFWVRHRRPPQEDRNVVMREGCKCTLEGTGLIVHPACLIHGATAKAGGMLPVAPVVDPGTENF